MSFVGVHGDVHGIDFGRFEMLDELGLFLWVKTEIRIDGENQPFLAVAGAAFEEFLWSFRIAFEEGVKA